jgi:hypothetical protein
MQPLHRAVRTTLALFLLATAGGADWYAAPKGTPTGKGSRESPWDVASALAGKPAVKPGDTLYLLGGTYRRRPQEQFDVGLTGAAGKPIQVRPAPGERPIIDGGLVLRAQAAHVWIWDLEVLVSEPQPKKPVGPGSHPADFTRPWGGIHTQSSGERGCTGCKFIHLDVHDCRQGMSLWAGTRDLEVYGCLIHDNGWRAVDRGHGHGIYTQNRAGVLTIADCIFTGGFAGAYSIHAYGSKRAYVNHYLIEGNLLYRTGPLLVGGGRPSEGIRVRDNVLYGVNLQLGYAAPHNEDCEVRGNVVVNGSLNVKRFRKVIDRDNLVLAEKGARPKGTRVVLRPSKYDPRRVHVAILNWERQRSVALDPGTFLKSGDAYRLLDPRDFFGKPVLSGSHDGKPIAVPMTGEFAAFVLLRTRR